MIRVADERPTLNIADLVPDVLQSWAIVPDDVTLISGNTNRHWRIRRGRESFVLRMYRRGQSEDSIRYELDILTRLRDGGWPVAAPIGDIVCHSGFMSALFPQLPGSPHERETPQQAHHRGRLLAELHQELNLITDVGQRPGWTSAVDISDSGGCALTGTIACYWESVTSRLHALGASSFSMTVIHGDFIAQNLLFQNERLSGILDFDAVHLDLRAADVACARRSRNDDVVRGYLEVIPLTAAELDCLDDLWRAAVLRYAVQIHKGDLAVENRAAELQWCVKQLEQTVAFECRRG